MDELDKRDPKIYDNIFPPCDDRETINIVKGGLSKDLNKLCSVIVIANPVLNKGKYDESLSIYEQTNFMESHISRLDLCFIFIDNKTDDQRERMWKKKSDRQMKIKLETDFFADDADKSFTIKQRKAADELTNETYSSYYVRRELMYLQKTFFPILMPSTDPHDLIYKFYNEFNKKNIHTSSTGGSISATFGDMDRMFTPAVDERTINTLRRLSEASARLHRRHHVTLEDAQIAINLVKYCLGKMIPRSQRFVQPDKVMEKIVKHLLASVPKQYIAEITDRMKAKKKRFKVFLQVLHNMIVRQCEICRGTGTDRSLSSRVAGHLDRVRCDNCMGKGHIYARFSYMSAENISREKPEITLGEVEDFFNIMLKSGVIEEHQMSGQYEAKYPLNDRGIFRLLDTDLLVEYDTAAADIEQEESEEGEEEEQEEQ